MNSFKSIGGFLELELPKHKNKHTSGIFLNSGRACIDYFLRVTNCKRAYLPKYTCDALIDPFIKHNIEIVYYSIDDNLEIIEQPYVLKNEILVYVNYFGLKDAYCNDLVAKYPGKILLDCTQAFYFKPKDSQNVTYFYSPRKYFGVPDGGILLTNIKQRIEKLPTDNSYTNFTHLIKRIDISPESAYVDFQVNEKSIKNKPTQNMSELTKRLLGAIDYNQIKKTRIDNFNFLNSKLKMINNLKITDLKGNACPLVYPLFINGGEKIAYSLIEKKIYIGKYWDDVIRRTRVLEYENQLSKDMVCLPIDQRYNESDMIYIANTLCELI